MAGMKAVLLSFVFVLASITGDRPRVGNLGAQQAKDLALSSDTVEIRKDADPAFSGLVIKNRGWIARFAATLGQVAFLGVDLGSRIRVGWETAYFYRNGKPVLSVAAISDHELRVLSRQGGGDFVVSERRWNAIDYIIKNARAWHNALRAEQLALSADTVKLRGELQPASAGVVVHDRRWIIRFAEALRQTNFSEVDHVFGMGWLAAYFYDDGKQVLSVVPIDSGGGGQQTLRAYSDRGGGDYVVSAKQCRVIEALMREKMKASRAPKAGGQAPADPTMSAGASRR